MEKTYKRVPFDTELAKKIQAGEIEGKIKTRDSEDVDEIVCFRKSLKFKVCAIINGRIHSFTERGFELGWDESGTWHGDLVLEVPDNEPQFKPFDKVLVRNKSNERWHPSLYATTDGLLYYTIDCKNWQQCVPYAGNEHLVGTTDKPKEE